MAVIKRQKTKYPGVFFIDGKTPDGKPEKIYYIRYKKDGKAIEEKAGRQYKNDMTPAKAAGIRGERIQGKDLSKDGTPLIDCGQNIALTGLQVSLCTQTRTGTRNISNQSSDLKNPNSWLSWMWTGYGSSC